MKYFFNQDINELIKTKKRIFLFLDYDGTLTPIVKNPYQAHLCPDIKKLLKKLSQNKNIVIGIISGRELSDVKKRVGINNLLYSGNHGLELYYKGKETLTEELDYKRYLRLLNPAKKELKKSLGHIEGVVFEDKRIIFAVHYRKIELKKAAAVKAIFKKTITPFLKDKKLKVSTGKRVLELRPNISCNKADAVHFFQNRLKKTGDEITIFIGDDLTDEDVFKKLKKPNLGIRIGRKSNSQAQYFLKNPQEIKQFLKTLKLKFTK
ncbi:MAG: trehalose-phosphatase [Candidatus Omnitrophota bacterium]